MSKRPDIRDDNTQSTARHEINNKNETGMIKTKVIAVLAAISCASAYASAYEKYPVSPLAWEINVERVGDVLFRYVRFSSESEYPCLRLETFEPTGNLKLLSRRDICKIRINHEIVDVRNDVSGSSFEKLRLEGNVFNFAADIILRRPGSYYLNCKVAISEKGNLSEPVCQEGERPPDSGDSK